MKGGSLKVKEIKAFLEASYMQDAPNEIFGYILDTVLSTLYGKIYVNDQLKKVVIAHRGTGKENYGSDWGNNAVYAANSSAYKMTNRFKTAEKMVKKAFKKYDGYQFESVGHSQAGLLTHLLSPPDKVMNSISLNPAYKTENIKPNEFIIRSAGDLVSAATVPKKYLNSILYPGFTNKHMLTIPSKSNNPLTNHSIDVLDNLDPEKVIGKGGSIPIKPKRELPGYIINIDL